VAVCCMESALHGDCVSHQEYRQAGKDHETPPHWSATGNWDVRCDQATWATQPHSDFSSCFFFLHPESLA